MRKFGIQIPSEGQHESGNDGLKQELVIGEQGTDQTEREHDTDRDQQQAGQDREQPDEGRQPQRNARLRRREFAGAALIADFGIARIRVPVLTEFEVVGPSAKVAKQRLAWRDAVTLIAIAHG